MPLRVDLDRRAGGFILSIPSLGANSFVYAFTCIVSSQPVLALYHTLCIPRSQSMYGRQASTESQIFHKSFIASIRSHCISRALRIGPYSSTLRNSAFPFDASSFDTSCTMAGMQKPHQVYFICLKANVLGTAQDNRAAAQRATHRIPQIRVQHSTIHLFQWASQHVQTATWLESRSRITYMSHIQSPAILADG